MGKISLPDKLPENETDFENTILDLLNSGGIEQLMSHYKQGNMTYKDVTNDQVKELIISGLYPRPSLFVFGCKDGQFIDLLKIPPGEEGNPEVLAIKDMNKDGKLELVIDMLACRYCKGAQIYEWNGESFDSLVKSWYFDDIVTNSIQFNDIADFAGSTDISIADIDHDGFDELVLDGGTPSGLAAMSGWEGPWRKQKMIYKWNGQAYVWFSQLYYPPKFRFEAIQDGDIQTARGDYDDAIKSYQAAIFETDLKSWDFDIWHNLVVENDEKRIFGYPDLKTMPFNQKEYQQLSSYARYRMFLIYLKREWMSDARTIFTTMQEKFPQGDPGYPYLQMATIFWEEYQSSHDLNQSCSKVIEFIKENKDTLDPLNSGSLWEKTYYPEDVCPYR